VKIEEGETNFNDLSLNQFRNLATDGYCQLDWKSGLIFSLKAPKSDQEDVTYLCLDQPYELKLSYWLPITEGYKERPMAISSIVSVQFCSFGDKSLTDVTKSWETWASCHPNESLRILEIDGIFPDTVTADSTLALNAMKIIWTPGIDAPVMNITIKCLSFTQEETLEGLPLLLQIDSYLENQVLNENGTLGPKLINRAFCHLKTIVRSRITRTFRTRGSMQRPDLWQKELGSDLAKVFNQEAFRPLTIFYIDKGHLPHPVFFMVRYIKDLKTNEEHTHCEQVEKMETKKQEKKIETEEEVAKIETPEKIVIFVKAGTTLFKENDEDEFNTLVCTPGNLYGFVLAFEEKFKMQSQFINGLFRRNEANEAVEVDDTTITNLANKTFKIEMVKVRVKGKKKMNNIILCDC